MPFSLRAILVVGAVALVVLVLSGIRKSKMRIEDALFWLVLSFFVLLLSIFPDIGIFFAGLFEVQSPVNFVFVFFIGVLLAKCFSLTKQVSTLENKVKELVQHVAIDRFDRYERITSGERSERNDLSGRSDEKL